MTRTNASKARRAAHTAKTKADQAEKAIKAAQAAKAKASQAKAKAKKAQAAEAKKVQAAEAKKAQAAKAKKAANTLGSQSGAGGFEPFTIRYSTRTILVHRPKTHKIAVNLVYKNFESLREHQLCFQTTQLHISHGYPVELTADSWKGIVESITSVEVVIGGQDY